MTPAEEPDLLVLGYDTELTYQKIQDAALLLRGGIEYVATHPDLNCPTLRGPIPDVGSFMALFEAACGRLPRVIGKPNVEMVSGALGRLGAKAQDVVMVGDRLATDVRMAKDAGIQAFLVLSGVTKREDVAASDVQPDEVFESLREVHAFARIRQDALA